MYVRKTTICTLFCLLLVENVAAFTLWSEKNSFMGPGDFHGPGNYEAKQELFSMVLSNLSFTTSSEFLMPFYNNRGAEPNICGESELSTASDGALSNGYKINENANLCSAEIAGRSMLIAVVAEGPLQGEQHYRRNDDGQLEVKMDLALDLGSGDSGVIKLNIFGTTGSVVVPYSLQTQRAGKGKDQAGKFKSGTVLEGRIGDQNNDGWIDGTLVSAGNIPLDSPFHSGEPFAIYRHFELNIPVEGMNFGNVKALVESREQQ